MRPLLNMILIIAITAGWLIFAPRSAEAATITVNTIADELNNDGDCSLREAIKAANQNVATDACPAGSGNTQDMILLSNGATYRLNSKLSISNNTSASQDLRLNVVTASGSKAKIDGNTVTRIFEIASGATVEFFNLIITNGYVSGTGGAISNAGNLTLTNSKVTFSFAEIYSTGTGGNGGGIYNTGIMTLNATSVSDNIANRYGGGIYNTGTLTIQNGSIISNNGMVYNSNANGYCDWGGIAIFMSEGSTMTIDSSYVQSHTNFLLNCFGGTIYNQGGSLTIRNNTLIGGNGTANTAMGVFSDNGTLTIADSTISYNSSAGVMTKGGNLSMNNAHIEHNASSGLILVGDAQVTNTTIRFNTNSRSEGGGIAILGNESRTVHVSINNSKISNNSSQELGGGIYIQHSGENTVNIQNTKIIGNQAPDGGAVMVQNFNDNQSTSWLTVQNTCFVNNSNVAVAFYNIDGLDGSHYDFTNNWWGDIAGPGPVGAGAGDTVDGRFDYSGFKTTPILGCPNRTNPNATITPTPSSTATFTPTPTPTITQTPSNSPTPTDTLMFTPSDTLAQTYTPSDTPSDTLTFTPSDTVTATDTPSDTPTPTDTLTITTTFTPTNTLTPSETPSPTVCATPASRVTLSSPAHRTHTSNPMPTFTWSSVSGAQSYRLMIYTEDRSFEYKKRLFVNAYTLGNGEALAPQKYLWRVRTQEFICGSWGDWSNRFTLFID